MPRVSEHICSFKICHNLTLVASTAAQRQERKHQKAPVCEAGLHAGVNKKAGKNPGKKAPQLKRESSTADAAAGDKVDDKPGDV